MSTRSPHRTIILILALVALLAAACGTNSDGDTIGVATLEDSAGAATDSDAESESTPEEAALEFSQCMRDEGLDFPDVTVDANGNPDIREAFESSGVRPGSEVFRDAMVSCASTLETIGFGGGQRASLGENTELQDAFVEFSACIRDQGYDVGDLTFGFGPGQGPDGSETGEPPERGEGETRGDFGDRNARFADQMGLDISDPDVAATFDECGPIIDTAFSGLGLGQG